MSYQRQPLRTRPRRGEELQRGRASHLSQQPHRAAFTLRGLDIGRLDRFIAQAQRAARRAEREFAGVTIEQNADGRISVSAAGMSSMRL